jgi:hypothetical protein
LVSDVGKISQETMDRCDIVKLSPASIPEYIPVKLDFFKLLEEAEEVLFPIYFLIGWNLIEYIKPKEFKWNSPTGSVFNSSLLHCPCDSQQRGNHSIEASNRNKSR